MESVERRELGGIGDQRLVGQRGAFCRRSELAIAGANEAGVVFVAAAGNSGSNNDQFGNYPSGFPLPNVVSVGSTNRTDVRSAFSSYGATTVHLFALGSGDPARARRAVRADERHVDGDPHVSGALALLKSRFPSMGAATMKTRSSIDRPDPGIGRTP